MPVEIPLTRGFVAIVDDEDAEKVSQYKWRVAHIRRKKYALTTINADSGRQSLFMHRLIFTGNAGTKEVVDHINGDGLDNQRSNLRASTVAQNGWNRVKPISTNTSGVTGVHWVARRSTWEANIIVNGKRHYLICHKNKEVAIAARLEAERKFYGEFAPLR